MSDHKPPIQQTIPVPLHAHARDVRNDLNRDVCSGPNGEPLYQGILRLDGMTILTTPDVYENPHSACQAASLAQVKVLREMNSYFGFFGNKDGELHATATLTHILKKDDEV